MSNFDTDKNEKMSNFDVLSEVSLKQTQMIIYILRSSIFVTLLRLLFVTRGKWKCRASKQEMLILYIYILNMKQQPLPSYFDFRWEVGGTCARLCLTTRGPDDQDSQINADQVSINIISISNRRQSKVLGCLGRTSNRCQLDSDPTRTCRIAVQSASIRSPSLWDFLQV